MDLFKRIGTQKKKFKVQFFIGRLKFSSYRAGKIYIVIKRGDHKVKSQQRLQMSQDSKINFNKEIMQIEATLYFDEKEKVYQEKTGELSVVLLDEKDNKTLLGDLIFDIAAYANSGQESTKENKKLENSPKKFQGRIQFNVFVKYIGEGSQSSADKVSDFFFGNKHKDGVEHTNGKEKVKKNQSKGKVEKEPEQSKHKKAKLVPQNNSDQSYEAEPTPKEKQKAKGSSKAEPPKSKVQQKNTQKEQQSNNRPQSISKNLVTSSNKNNNNNNQKAYLTSDNQENDSKQPFYFDEPFTKDPREKNTKTKQTKQQSEVQKPVKGSSKPTQSGQGKGKQKMIQNSQQQGSEGEEDVATSQVQAVEVGHVFAKSQAQQVTKNKPLVKSQVTSLKDEPIPVKIRDKNAEKSLAKENSLQRPSKKSEENYSKLIKEQQEKRRQQQKEQENKQKESRSIDKRKQLKPQEQKREKQSSKGQKRKENSRQKVRQEEFEFGKKMSRDWLQKKQANLNNQSEQEYDFTQNVQSNGKEQKGKTEMNKNKPINDIDANKFKKSIIEQLIPTYSDKEKDTKVKLPQSTSKPINAFEEYSEEQNQQQQQYQSKYTTTSNIAKNKPLSIPTNSTYQKLAEQNSALKQRLESQQSTIKQLQLQLRQAQSSLEEMSQQVNYYQSQLKLKEQELQEHKNHTTKTLKNVTEERGSMEKLQSELKSIEKMKNQLIVENSKLKEKYRKEFAQYEQVLEEKQTEALTNQKTLKADILKLKDENSSLRSQVEKLTGEGTLKAQQNLKLKDRVNVMQKESTEVKQALSNLKFKICTLLNQALSTGQQSAIQLLMELNKH